MSNVAELILIVDMLLIVRNPFYPRYKRMPCYNLIFIFSIVLVVIYAIMFKQQIFMATLEPSFGVLKALWFSIMPIFNIIVLLRALYRIKTVNKGVNREFNQKVFKHYGTMLILQVPIYFLLWYSTLKNFDIIKVDYVIHWFSNIRLTFYFFSMVFVLIRASEPYIFYNVVPRFLLCCSSKKDLEVKDSYTSYLNSTMNT
jgi:hypothetical protein